MAQPLISVIVPTYNREHCVRASLDSVLAQTFKDYELIVVDDGSQDGTVEILKSYGDKIRLICQKNAGAGAARNTAIRAAQGKYIAFLDSDDQWRPEKLEVQMKYIAQYGAKVCYSRCVGENGEPLRDIEEVTATLKEPGVYRVADPVEFCSRARCHPYLQSMVLEKELFNAAGLFDQALHTGDDTLWVFRLSYLTDCLYIDRPMTVIYRGSDNSLTYDLRPAAAEKRWNAFIRMQAEIYWRLRQTHPQQAGLTRGRLGYSITNRAELACAAGDFPLARSLAWDALPFSPSWRIFVHAALLWLAPALVRGRFRKKWHRK
ncbi:MAG: glycosyltransferase family 2 protein [Verrucomicrobiae bacterium]|nr:glycosyltransferase family 2 protein [Verrucomicrobiae bacterium]